MKTEKIAENIKEILQLIGDNNEREGLGGTPERVAKMFKEVLIYNEGKMSDQEARELTIFFQQQVPFNEIELLPLIKEIVSYTGEYQLPYTQEEVEEKLKMLNFDWEEYEKTYEEGEKKNKEIVCPKCGHIFSK